MPPQHAQQPDVLDQALAVARAKTPAKVPGQTGFFNALKPNSPLFPQTSRVNVANPAAQQRVQHRIVPAVQPPAPTHPAAKPAGTPGGRGLVPPAHHGSSLFGAVEGAAKGVGSYVEHHPLRAAATVALPGPLSVLANPLNAKGAAAANTIAGKGLAHLGPGQAPDLSGEASTNAGLLNAAQGVPLASMSTAAQQKLRAAAAFFATNPSYKYDVPNLGLFGAKDKAAYKLPPTATDGDYIRAIGNETANFGHRGFLSTLVHNIPQGALQLAAAPVGAAYLATHPISGGKEFAREQFQFGKDAIEHPLNTLKTQPVPFVTSLLGATRFAGGLAGTIARTGVAGEGAQAFATPSERIVTPNLGRNPVTAEGVELKPHAINRGMTSPKLDERIVQAVSDKLAGHAQVFGKHLQQVHANDITRNAVRGRDALEREHVEPAIRAAAKLSPTEERATRFIHGQGLGTPKEHADFMQQQADAHRATTPDPGKEARWTQEQRALDADAKLWNKVAKNRKVGDTLTPKQQDYLDKATHASRFGEQDLASMTRQGTNVPLVSPETALRSAYAGAAAVRGINVLDTPAMEALRAEQRAAKGAPEVAPGSPLDEHDPLFNPHYSESPKTMAGMRRGNTLPMMHDNPAVRFGNHRLGSEGDVRTGALIPKGMATSAPHAYFGAVAKPLRVAAALEHFRAQGATWIRDVPADTAYDPKNWVRVRDDHTGAPNSDVQTLADTHEATRNADDTQTLRQQILGGVQDEKGDVAYIPADGATYHLAPRQSINNLENRLKGIDHGTLAKIAKTGTGLWRWTTLMARPAWLVNNIAGNVVQASIAGAGPGDWIKAWKQGAGGHPVEGVENAGQFKNVMERKPTLGNRALKPVHAFTNYVVQANVQFENLARRAVANHALSTLAKAHVHGEIGTIRSSFHHTSQAVRDAMDNPTPEMQARAVKETDRALGNFIRTKTSTGLDLLSPFHRWFEFITKYTFKLPVETPGRALLLQRLGQFGINVQNQAFGGFVPNSKQGSIKLPSWLPIYGGEYKSTQGLNPLASLYQLLDLTDQSSTNPNALQAGGLAGATNPLLMSIVNWATGKDNTYSGDNNSLLDQYGTPVGGFNSGVLRDQLLGTLPIVSAIKGFTPAKGQPRSTPADRLGGYLFGGVGPYDPETNQYAKLKQLKTAEITKARNKLAKG